MIDLARLDRTVHRRPLWAQIATALREAITDGRLRPGDYVPSENELVQYFGVTRMTVRRAIQELKIENLVSTQQGQRSVVASIPTDATAERRITNADIVDELRAIRELLEGKHEMQCPSCNATIRARMADS